MATDTTFCLADGFLAEEKIMAFLKSHAWPTGLQKMLVKQMKKNAHRFYILDDSGSMMSNDGKMIVNGREISCSRWTELGDAMKFHVNLAKEAGSRTEFRFLNTGKPFVIGDNSSTDDAKVFKLFDVFNECPNGATPLCKHIMEVKAAIAKITPHLRETNQRASLVICTDGEPSDGDIRVALSSLMGLPVDIVIRLCTNEDNIVEFWNEIDSNLEVTLDILDDWKAEGFEVQKHNNWVNYCLPVQRFRECGFSLKEFDLLEERKLSAEELRRFVIALTGNGDLPNPTVNWAAFVKDVERDMNVIGPLYNPVTRKKEKAINMAKMKSAYGPGVCCSIA